MFEPIKKCLLDLMLDLLLTFQKPTETQLIVHTVTSSL